jgi:UDP-N-acetylmuramyl pentapeptide phosphotransferase/UDP-N-acetylglucosamine-1-phosphate transferase
MALAALLLSAILVGMSVLYARRAGHLDVPNHRSSHRLPTPRGAGIGFVITVLILGTLLSTRVAPQSVTALAYAAGALTLLAVVGWLDDRFSLSALTRLGVHILAAAAVVLLVNRVAPLPGLANIPWLLLWGFWTVSSINIVNFMDGIDGMVGAQALVYGLFLYAVLPAGSLARLFGLTLAFASLGFLIWNWAPAKIFLGDVGSGPLGMMLVIAGALAVGAGMNPLLVFLPLFPLFFDALATVTLRLRRHENLTVAHRSHLYQRLAAGSAGHAVVSASYAAAAAIGAVVAALLQKATGGLIFAGVLCYMVLTISVWNVLHRRFPLSLSSPLRFRFPSEDEV